VIVGGVNGSGKSTFAQRAAGTDLLLGQVAINPDELSKQAKLEVPAPLSKMEAGTKTTLADLAILCSNCHRVIHRRTPMLTPRQLATQIPATRVSTPPRAKVPAKAKR